VPITRRSSRGERRYSRLHHPPVVPPWPTDVGVSETSWEDAGRKAVETAAGSLRDLRVAEVAKMDMKVDNGKVTAFRTRVALSFKYETE
jgi:dodecin